MIRCLDVCKIYKQGENEITALAGITLDIVKGSFAVIMGPSGSGKSTLLHLIGGLDRPSSGDLLVDGRLIGAVGYSIGSFPTEAVAGITPIEEMKDAAAMGGPSS